MKSLLAATDLSDHIIAVFEEKTRPHLQVLAIPPENKHNIEDSSACRCEVPMLGYVWPAVLIASKPPCPCSYWHCSISTFTIALPLSL